MAFHNSCKIIFVANTSWYLYNFRLSLMQHMVKRGYYIIAVAPRDDYSKKIEEMRIKYIDVPVSRKGKNPFVDLILLLRLIKLYKREKPIIVHHFTPKVVIYGSLAARFANIKNVVNSITGLGNAFVKGGILQNIVEKMYKIAFSENQQIIFQNPNDRELFLQHKTVSPKSIHLIKGSGIDTEYLSSSSNKIRSNDNITFTLISRMIWDKGVGVFVEAAKLVKKKYLSAQFVIVGGLDNDNPNAVPEKYLKEQEASGYIKWTGHIDEIKQLIDSSDVIVLPTYYREGVPRSLIEGSSMAKPLIATTVPGCWEVVDHGVNGLLVPPRDVNSLAKAMLKLAKDPELRYQMGQNGRKKVLEEFDDAIIIEKTLEVYKKAGL